MYFPSDQKDKRLTHYHEELQDLLFGSKESDDLAKGVLKVSTSFVSCFGTHACGSKPVTPAHAHVCIPVILLAHSPGFQSCSGVASNVPSPIPVRVICCQRTESRRHSLAAPHRTRTSR